MYLVALGQQKLREITAILSGDACDECFFHLIEVVMERSEPGASATSDVYAIWWIP
jgi:hypothetical protein